jgi:hypothetical protein
VRADSQPIEVSILIDPLHRFAQSEIIGRSFAAPSWVISVVRFQIDRWRFSR